jgi:Dolichyl-phosphate-mannose-protein mannosyltransferase
MKRWLPVLFCLLHFSALVFFARQHSFGTYATETDFYHYYAPDAARIAAGQFPENKFQGPGYPAALALVAHLTGRRDDLFTAAKWFSVVCAVACGGLIFLLFSRVFDFWVGLGAQAVAVVSGEFPQFSIQAATDVFFLLLCLAIPAVLLSERLPVRGRVMAAGALAGAAYVVRYNGLFLLVVCLTGILVLNLFEQPLRRRLPACAMFLAMFLLVASPWLYANAKHRGSPFYNANYLNLATEFYPELAGGEVNQDGTRALERRFRSFADVLRHDPARLLARYPVNLWESLRLSIHEELVQPWVGWMAWLGAALALIGRRSKSVRLLLLSGAFYLLLMALNHWETRYYFFLMALYAGFAVFAVRRVFLLAKAAGWLRSPAAALAPAVLIALMFALSLAKGRNNLRLFLDSHPAEVLAARDYLQRAGIRDRRIVARKPHLAYLTRNEWVFFPPVQSLDELHAWLNENRVDYVAISRREIKERRKLAPLGKPKNAPDWLQAVWANDDPTFVLYAPKIKK